MMMFSVHCSTNEYKITQVIFDMETATLKSSIYTIRDIGISHIHKVHNIIIRKKIVRIRTLG